MAKILNIKAWLVGIIMMMAGLSGCGNTSSEKTQKISGEEWNVTVHRAWEFNDTVNGIGITTDCKYRVADTAQVNQALAGIKPETGHFSFGWTIESSDGTVWLVAYEDEPLLSERVKVTTANSLPEYEGNVQVAFRFADADKWAAITEENIGKRLAVIVNGQVMNAPQVNMRINSGNCSVSIPADKIREYLPNLDMEKLKQ
nr:hypothetical protein [Bacteroides sp.]